jgi:hypothetical protein
MEHNLDNLKLKDLQDICKKYNLKTYGKKSFKRIRDHEIAQIEQIEVALTATDSNTNENDESKMDNLELDSSDEGELVDVLNYNQSPTKSDTSCETIYRKETNSNKRIAVRVGDCFDPILDPTSDRNPFWIEIRKFRIAIKNF